jgi:hypothetical protein
MTSHLLKRKYTLKSFHPYMFCRVVWLRHMCKTCAIWALCQLAEWSFHVVISLSLLSTGAPTFVNLSNNNVHDLGSIILINVKMDFQKVVHSHLVVLYLPKCNQSIKDLSWSRCRWCSCWCSLNWGYNMLLDGVVISVRVWLEAV